MATGRVRVGFFHIRTRPAGLSQKPGPGPFIKRVFFLTPNPARRVPAGPIAMPRFGPKPWPNPKKKKKILPKAHTVAQKLNKKCLPRFFENVFAQIQALILGKHKFFFLY